MQLLFYFIFYVMALIYVTHPFVIIFNRRAVRGDEASSTG